MEYNFAESSDSTRINRNSNSTMAGTSSEQGGILISLISIPFRLRNTFQMLGALMRMQ